MAFPLKDVQGIPNFTLTGAQRAIIKTALEEEWGQTEEDAIDDLGDALKGSDKPQAVSDNGIKLLKLGLMATGLYDPEDFSM